MSKCQNCNNRVDLSGAIRDDSVNSDASKNNQLIENAEYVGESISEDGVRIIHKRIHNGECIKCRRIRRWALQLGVVVGGTVVVWFITDVLLK